MMRTRPKNPHGLEAWAIFWIVTLCLLVGGGIPLFAEIIGDHPGRLLALPALLLLGVLMIYDYKKLLILIILLRSAGDILLDSTQVGAGEVRMGVGGLINLFVIMIACLMVLEQPRLFPARLVRHWVPIMLMMAIGVIISYEKANAIKQYLSMLSCLAIFIIALYAVRTTEDFNNVIRLVLCSSLLPSLYAVVEIALYMRDSNFRLQSTFTHANILAFYLTLMLVLCLYMLKSRLFAIKPRCRTAICCYMPVLLGQLLLTQCRSAWLACFVVFVLYALIFERKYLLYLLLVPFAVMFIPAVSERVMDLGQGNEVVGYSRLNSFAWRQILWRSAIDWMEPVRLVYGYGLDGFGHFAPTFFPLDRVTKWDAHNVYVQFLFDTGLVGLLCYLWLHACLLWTLRRLEQIDRVSAFLLMAVVLQYLIVSYSDNMIRYLVFNWYFWLIVGGACSLVSVHGQSNRPKPMATSCAGIQRP